MLPKEFIRLAIASCLNSHMYIIFYFSMCVQTCTYLVLAPYNFCNTREQGSAAQHPKTSLYLQMRSVIEMIWIKSVQHKIPLLCEKWNIATNVCGCSVLPSCWFQSNKFISMITVINGISTSTVQGHFFFLQSYGRKSKDLPLLTLFQDEYSF